MKETELLIQASELFKDRRLVLACVSLAFSTLVFILNLSLYQKSEKRHRIEQANKKIKPSESDNNI